MARAIESGRGRATALAGLAHHLPEAERLEVLQEAPKEIRTFEWEVGQAAVLATLAPHLPQPLLQEALTLVGGINSEVRRAALLEALAPHLPEALLQEALEMALAIISGKDRAAALENIALQLARLPSQRISDVWGVRLHTLAARSRKDFLIDLYALQAIIAVLGGEQALVDIVHAIQDVGRWWP